jgi:CopG family nickel-responsive transcriptional regulator
MADLVRFSVSLEADLLEAFDDYVKEGRFATRSEAIRQLLRTTLTREAWEADTSDVSATLTLVYDHHKPGLVDKLIELQHQHAEQVTASMHVHLDHDHCMEVIILRGKASRLRQLASGLRGLKGVHQGELTMTGVIPPHRSDCMNPGQRHDHSHSHPHPAKPDPS